MDEIKKRVVDLKPKHYRSLQGLGSDWYKQVYHTKYHVTKQNYLEHLYDKAVGDIRVEEPNQSHVEPYVQALKILQGAVTDPTTVGLPDPNAAPAMTTQGQKRSADTTVSQSQSKTKRGTSAPSSYASALTGPADGKSQPIGAQTPKSGQPKVPAKFASGAIGAPAPAKPPPKQSAGGVAIGANTSHKDTSKQPDPTITADSALQYLIHSKGTETFDEYHAAKAKSQTSTQPDGGSGHDDQDDAALQQAIRESRQQSQPQGSDPAAASSTSGPRSTQDELQEALQTGRDLHHESDQLEIKC